MKHLKMHPVRESFTENELIEYKGKRSRILGKEDGLYDIFVLPDRETIYGVEETELSALKRCLGQCDRKIVDTPDGGREIYCSGCDRTLRRL